MTNHAIQVGLYAARALGSFDSRGDHSCPRTRLLRVIVAHHISPRIDPWLYRATGGRYPWILGGVSTAPLMFLAVEITDPDEYPRMCGLAEQVCAGWSDYRLKTDPIGRHIAVFRLKPR